MSELTFLIILVIAMLVISIAFAAGMVIQRYRSSHSHRNYHYDE